MRDIELAADCVNLTLYWLHLDVTFFDCDNWNMVLVIHHWKNLTQSWHRFAGSVVTDTESILSIWFSLSWDHVFDDENWQFCLLLQKCDSRPYNSAVFFRTLTSMHSTHNHGRLVFFGLLPKYWFGCMCTSSNKLTCIKTSEFTKSEKLTSVYFLNICWLLVER